MERWMGSGDTDPIGTILLVDDDKDLREFLYQHLLQCGHSVLQAGSGTEAVERFRHHLNDIDILVTDIVMPGYSGDQLAVKLAEEKPGLPVLFISGNSPQQIQSLVPLHEGENFLRKPFSLESLERAIAKLFRTLG
ncbi:MAG TPA: response regulator [Candidatus Kapabacteria bacterium]|jgi:two-component system, cell cycle sensor histidine kinase and response regulator CckA|nr:response regulator [Candidatus Kapabacteria bacterium]